MVSNLWTTLYILWIALEIVVAVATRTGRTEGKVQDRGSQVLLWVVIVASVTACFWTAHLVTPNIPGAAHWLRAASVVVLTTGVAIRVTAIVSLGKSFSANVAILETQTVHRAGLYRFVRHPSYLGLLLVFLAIGLHAGNWLSLAFGVIPTTAALLWRIHIEEAALNDAFGGDYAAYCRSTKRLVPGVF
jgi:protein-S-isoprenylcysteine O-methyltransferase Ste14